MTNLYFIFIIIIIAQITFTFLILTILIYTALLVPSFLNLIIMLQLLLLTAHHPILMVRARIGIILLKEITIFRANK